MLFIFRIDYFFVSKSIIKSVPKKYNVIGKVVRLPYCDYVNSNIFKQKYTCVLMLYLTNTNTIFRISLLFRHVKPIASTLQYIMLVDYLDEDTHGLLKLFEAFYKIPTQHVTMERVFDVNEKYRKQTLENIINKMNCKNSGLNYVPRVPGSGIIFLYKKGNRSLSDRCFHFDVGTRIYSI